MTACSPKVLIFGSNGQLGRALCSHPARQAYHVIAYSRMDLDITDAESLKTVVSTLQPHVIINAAAYTAVDQAEEAAELAMQVNYFAVEKLAILCSQYQIPLIHLSTDYVFDGKKTEPYVEEDDTHPLNIYGQSKWLGEEAIRYHTKQYIILRLSGLFSEHRRNFVKTILKQANEKQELRVISDQITCPTLAADVASAIYHLINQLSFWGTYHFCSTPAVSWYQFAKTIINLAKQQEKCFLAEVKAISTTSYVSKVVRPPYSVLNCGKIFKDYRISQPLWDEHLKEIIHACL